MKRFERPRTSTHSQPRTSTNSAKKDQKPRSSSKGNGLKPLNAAQLVSRVLDATASEPSSTAVTDSTTGSESSEVYDNVNVHYMDDANDKSRNDGNLVDCQEEGNGDESDYEANNESVFSSQGDLFSHEDKKSERPSMVSKSKSSQDRPFTSKGRTNISDSVRSRSNTFHGSARKTVRSSKSQAKALSEFSSYRSSENNRALSPASPVDSTPFEEAKEDDEFEDALNSVNNTESDNETTLVYKEIKRSEVEKVLTQKIETMETRIKNLEEELREVAALEMSLYSVFPEHESSSHKLHKPARDLFRFYALARKNQSENKLISVTKNIVSGLSLLLKSCGSDVSRLTYWLSNTVMLREIISEEFGGTNLNGSNSLKEDWTDVRTLIAALRRVERCLFTQAVESIWSQVMMVYMRPEGVDSTMGEMIGNFAEPATCDRLQESFSVNLWKKAFEEALQRLCPVQAKRRQCGCLHVLTRMVMEQCIVRLDVAMFNAILREWAHQIPTDSASDPIADSRVLPIPAGVLSFESGVKLKNTVGYWSRLLTDIFELDVVHSPEKEQQMQRGDESFKPFHLLNELSDLLMLPKEMLVDSSTRDEVCPSIGLSLIKRILCNFTPDEFCPYPVPGTVLEELNAQSILESRSSSGDATRCFPRQVNPVSYYPPSCSHLTDIVAEFTVKLKLSMTQKKGYSRNEEVDTSRSPPYYNILKGAEEKDAINFSQTNERYRLLGEA
ncbi:Dilute domain [Arabidopsis suecica]|uniref:Dilute domain n=1 Tax=Arabidopsis suecica TaxID=45249 RepID=A0A8T1Z8E8_ARASU|nr:Dilute domain [Arabidopsis suecica]